MRYARGTQYGLYACKGNNKDYKWFKKARKGMGNITIEENKTLWPYNEKLDSTFNWDRVMGRVCWSFVNGDTETTMFALLKYTKIPRWIAVRLKRKE
ncbi:hypothetical protein P4H56_33145 [Bacillus cereus]|uniref:Uncharacterized protein n=1 Tax=Bacillus thuringiensis TaxID=1428 RepID=A0A643LJX6_BACTU|nr:hypothetical protein [Bacillus thuringiensis]MDA2526643.1 hypothetical protein [Bacillus cereus]AHZ49061.1 hypothetical protein YBT1520_01430 [Bacillus thuringiensis serovar kurstaki str. YBT-1520]KAB1345118.1 hypothetical protein FPG91_30525 [Bacillus thuringiensis]KAB1347190.1 hypothetical protein FPG94_30135 [Bacillus thuringiensis]KAB1350402.1 hypothetical protein FPG90_23665 [Bacillus thuringiensis]